MRQIEVFIPSTIAWLMRMVAVPNTRWVLGKDAVLFAKWYVVGGELIHWPDDVEKMIETERQKKIGIDRMATLMQKLGFKTTGMSADKTRALMEGYVVHEWVSSNWEEFTKLAAATVVKYKYLWEDSLTLTGYSKRVNEMCKALNLTALQTEILQFAFMCGVGEELAGLVHELNARWSGQQDIWSTLFDATPEKIVEALAVDGALRKSGILEAHHYNGIVKVNDFWMTLLNEPGSSFEDLIVEPFKPKTNAGVMAVLSEEDSELAIKILNGKKPNEAGVNLLLYGATHLDKRYVLQQLLAKTEFQPWRLKCDENVPSAVRRGMGYLAFCLMQKHKDRILIIEKPSDLLTQQQSSFFKMLFGVEVESEKSEDVDQLFLNSFTIPAVWLLSDVARLSSDTVARFVYHAPLKKADRNQRQTQMAMLLQDSKLGIATKDAISKLDGISTLQIESALQAAQLAGATKGKARDEAVMLAIKRSQKALGRDLTERFKTSVTSYSLNLLNCSGRFGPPQIMEALRKNRRGTMVFYGPPGTGKTQLVEHIAAELGMPLIAKRASELMGKYVGENEKNIADMFEEATNEDAILLLDEGDSFLRDRSFARAQWEVTMVNELLQHMERFPGIFVVCTNLFEGLDAAALRRFTFKLEFNALTPDQRWKMFVNEADIIEADLNPELKTKWRKTLQGMHQLAAGDFATVQRQCKILDVMLSPDEWLVQLEQEVRVKRKPEQGPILE